MKSPDIPYITHPIEAGLIAMTMSDDPDVAVAAILHDVVEDTPYSEMDIEQGFGTKVAELVAHESEDKMRHMPAEDSWKRRKEAFLEHLKEAPLEAKIICLADKLSNMRLTAKEHREKGDAMWLNFNQKDKKEQEWYYRSIYKNISELEGTEAYQEYIKLCDKVFA
jgi:myo-inositol-1(or 4)-monophosphatase